MKPISYKNEAMRLRNVSPSRDHWQCSSNASIFQITLINVALQVRLSISRIAKYRALPPRAFLAVKSITIRCCPSALNGEIRVDSVSKLDESFRCCLTSFSRPSWSPSQSLRQRQPLRPS